MSSILTIAIPTYNRRKHLGTLLTALLEQVRSCSQDVALLVSDNASPDDTSAVLAEFEQRFPGLRVLRNAENIGAERNIAQCFETAQTPFVWIMGDDDVPRFQVIEQLLDILKQQNPDLVYIKSEWKKEIRPVEIGAIPQLQWRSLPRARFADEVNVWTTFLSGIIVNKRALLDRSPSFDPLKYLGSYLISLGWTLDALRLGDRFIVVDSPGVLATKGNTGGYAVLNVFGINFQDVVRSAFGADSAIATRMIHRNVVGFLPGLIWSVRFNAGIGSFIFEFPEQVFADAYPRSLLYRWLLRPIAVAPKPLAWLILKFSRVLIRILR